MDELKLKNEELEGKDKGTLITKDYRGIAGKECSSITYSHKELSELLKKYFPEREK